MNLRVSLMALALVAAPFVAVAEGEKEVEQKALSCISDVVWSQDFLKRYPKAPPACREVQVKNGEKWVRFEAKVAKTKGDQITVDFLNVAGDPLGNVTFVATPGATLEINGKSQKYTSLRKGDKMSFWMPETRVGFYAAPGVPASQELKAVESTM